MHFASGGPSSVPNSLPLASCLRQCPRAKKAQPERGEVRSESPAPDTRAQPAAAAPSTLGHCKQLIPKGLSYVPQVGGNPGCWVAVGSKLPHDRQEMWQYQRTDASICGRILA